MNKDRDKDHLDDELISRLVSEANKIQPELSSTPSDDEIRRFLSGQATAREKEKIYLAIAESPSFRDSIVALSKDVREFCDNAADISESDLKEVNVPDLQKVHDNSTAAGEGRKPLRKWIPSLVAAAAVLLLCVTQLPVFFASSPDLPDSVLAFATGVEDEIDGAYLIQLTIKGTEDAGTPMYSSANAAAYAAFRQLLQLDDFKIVISDSVSQFGPGGEKIVVELMSDSTLVFDRVTLTYGDKLRDPVENYCLYVLELPSKRLSTVDSIADTVRIIMPYSSSQEGCLALIYTADSASIPVSGAAFGLQK